MTEAEEFVCRMVNAIVDTESDSFGLQSNLVEEVGMDSVDFMDLLHEVEKRYHVKLPVEEWMEKIRTGAASTSDYFVVERLAAEIEAAVGDAKARTA